MIRVEATATIRAAQPTVSEVYADYSNWRHVFPTINGVRVISGDGPELLLEVDHAEGKVRNELLIRSPGVIELWEAKRRYTAHFVNRFEVLPDGTRYSVRAEIALKGTARLLHPLLHGHIRRQIKRWLLQPVQAVAEQRAGTSALWPASPPGLDACRSRAGTIAAYGLRRWRWAMQR